MFEKREYRTFGGTGTERFYNAACHYWASQGFHVTRISQNRIHGESYDSRIGLKRRFALTLHQQYGNNYLDLQFKAKATDMGLIGGVFAAVIFWPVAVIGGLWSYSEYESDANDLSGRFWEYMNTVAYQPGGN